MRPLGIGTKILHADGALFLRVATGVLCSQLAYGTRIAVRRSPAEHQSPRARYERSHIHLMAGTRLQNIGASLHFTVDDLLMPRHGTKIAGPRQDATAGQCRFSACRTKALRHSRGRQVQPHRRSSREMTCAKSSGSRWLHPRLDEWRADKPATCDSIYTSLHFIPSSASSKPSTILQCPSVRGASVASAPCLAQPLERESTLRGSEQKE